MTTFTVRSAVKSDEQGIKSLLKKADLPFEDVEVGRQQLIVATIGGRVIGSVGLEAYGEHGLLRSLAIKEELRGRGLGRELTEEMEDVARSKGVRALYLLTMTAAPFFAKLGFEKADRSKAPAALQGTTEFASLCPVSSVCMKKRL